MNPRDLIIDAKVLAGANSFQQFCSFMHLAVDSDEADRHIVSDLPEEELFAQFDQKWMRYVEGMCHGLEVDVSIIIHGGSGRTRIRGHYGYEFASVSFSIHVYPKEFWNAGSPESDIVAEYEAPHPSMPDFLVRRLSLRASNESPVVVLTDCGDGAFWVTIVGSENEEG